LTQHAPLTLIRDALPTALATTLLRQLHAESASWARGSWMMFNQRHELPRTTAWYELGGGDAGDAAAGGGETDDGRDDGADQNTGDNAYVHVSTRCEPSAELLAAADVVTATVRRLRPSSGWAPTGVLANRYAHGDECVGPHADHISMLGPRPIIVGLSLGATRRFDLSEQPATAAASATDSGAAEGTTGEGARRGGATAQLTLPHNSLLIMWDDAQERWVHSVPRCAESAVGRHPLSGPVRFSLTMRMKRADMPPMPLCHCGEPAALKAGRDNTYWTFCDPSRSRTKAGRSTAQCGFRQRCLWAEREASRMRDATRIREEVRPSESERNLNA